jgi:hypothetical protein
MSDGTQDEIARIKAEIKALEPELQAGEAELIAAEKHLKEVKERVYTGGETCLRNRMGNLKDRLAELKAVAPIEPLGYPRVRKGNNWGALYYVAGDTDLEAGMKVSVAFPGQEKALETVLLAEKYSMEVGDMGRYSTVTSDRLYVLVPNEYGAEAKIYLNDKMGVKVIGG